MMLLLLFFFFAIHSSDIFANAKSTPLPPCQYTRFILENVRYQIRFLHSVEDNVCMSCCVCPTPSLPTTIIHASSFSHSTLYGGRRGVFAFLPSWSLYRGLTLILEPQRHTGCTASGEGQVVEVFGAGWSRWREESPSRDPVGTDWCNPHLCIR